MDTKYFFAKDIYPKWVKYIKKANSSVVIFSPYVDNALKDLISNTDIKKLTELKIISRVDSSTIFDKPYQVRSLVNCLKTGAEIYHLEDLHAKILLIDRKFIVIGSQNFTYAGKKNKETSVTPPFTFEGSIFLNIIENWILKASKIDSEYLNKLEIFSKKYRPKIEKIKAEHASEFEQITKNHIDHKKRELEIEIKKQQDNSLLKFAYETVYITKKNFSNYNWQSHQFNDITTFVADKNVNLLFGKNKDGELIKLNWLSYCPMINIENSEIALVRLASTRISFYHKNATKYLKINEEGFWVNIHFPTENTQNTNLEFNITPYNTENSTNFAHLSYYFNGSNCRRINDIYSGPEFKEIINNLFLSSKEKENDFIRLIFKGYNISVKGGGIYNFLDGQCYKISIIQHLNNPILTCEKIY
ncbi:MAG: phospholipase D-like domain-containing protein [Saprospiraceae bacterium]|mgnify:FL=1